MTGCWRGAQTDCTFFIFLVGLVRAPACGLAHLLLENAPQIMRSAGLLSRPALCRAAGGVEPSAPRSAKKAAARFTPEEFEVDKAHELFSSLGLKDLQDKVRHSYL